MNEPLVLLHRAGPAAVLTLNRPEKRNALSPALVAALGKRLSEVVVDPQVRAVILTGNGPAFCAGLDLDQLAELMRQPDARDRMRHDSRQLAAVYRALATSAKPTIAAVGGPAVAGGAGLVTACDLAVATPAARFGYPEVRRGIVPAIVTDMLMRQVSSGAARYLLLTGQVIEATEAARLGIYQATVPPEQLMETALELAEQIARGGPAAVATTKQWIERCRGEGDLWVQGADASAEARFTEECAEGLAAFGEKRDPNWVRPKGMATPDP